MGHPVHKYTLRLLAAALKWNKKWKHPVAALPSIFDIQLLIRKLSSVDTQIIQGFPKQDTRTQNCEIYSVIIGRVK